jgi:hypothetical protein
MIATEQLHNLFLRRGMFNESAAAAAAAAAAARGTHHFKVLRCRDHRRYCSRPPARVFDFYHCTPELVEQRAHMICCQLALELIRILAGVVDFRSSRECQLSGNGLAHADCA